MVGEVSTQNLGCATEFQHEKRILESSLALLNDFVPSNIEVA